VNFIKGEKQMVSKRQTTQYNHFCKVKSSLYELFSRTKSFKLSFPEYLELKKKMYHDHPSMGKRRNGENFLNNYYRGCLNGIEETLFHRIQTEEVQWLHYYINEEGKTIYEKNWLNLPDYIKEPKGLVKSNHFWKNPRDINNPKPWGTNPATF
jgi:hypothetical protein